MGKEALGMMVTLATTAFGLVAALAWNEAITALFTEFGPETGSGWSGLLVYAVLVTIIAVVVTMMLAKMADKAGVSKE